MQVLEQKPEIHTAVTYADTIPDITKEEAGELSLIEVERVIALLEQLEGDDWHQATDCTEWTVRDMAAHLSGACRGWADWGHFNRQYVMNPYYRPGVAPIHSINKREVQDRRSWSTDAVIKEMRDYGAKSVNTRQNIPQAIRKMKLPLAPLGVVPVSYLLDIIYPRDQWMHRGDICRATGKQMVFTKAYDERVTDLVMLDIAERLNGALQGALDVIVTGGVEKVYRFGQGASPDATLTIDVLELNRRASLRSSFDEACQVSTITGNEALAMYFLEHGEAGY